MMLQDKEVTPESEDISTVSSRDNITVMTTRRSLGRSAALQKIGSQQDKWKQQVSLVVKCVVDVIMSDLSLITSGPGTADTYIRSTHDAQLKTHYSLYSYLLYLYSQMSINHLI